MLKLNLRDEYRTSEDLLLALEHIVPMIGRGFTSGLDPDWDLTGEEEPLTNPDSHHEDCDFRLSSAAVEHATVHGWYGDEPRPEVHDCNLDCE